MFKEYVSENSHRKSIVAMVLAQLAFEYNETKKVKQIIDDLVNYDAF